jgi:hypothetical protein
MLEIFDGVLLAVNKLATHNEIRPLMGIDDIRTISKAILEILRENRTAAAAMKKKKVRDAAAIERGAGADFMAAAKKKKLKREKADGGDVGEGDGYESDAQDDADEAFPGGAGGDDDGDKASGAGSPRGGMGDVVGAVHKGGNEIDFSDLADPSRVKRQSMQCVEILTSLKQKGKAFVQEIMALETGGDVEEQTLARQSLASLGLTDGTGFLSKEVQALFSRQMSEVGEEGDENGTAALNFVGGFMEKRMDEFAAKMWKKSLMTIKKANAPMHPFGFTGNPAAGAFASGAGFKGSPGAGAGAGAGDSAGAGAVTVAGAGAGASAGSSYRRKPSQLPCALALSDIHLLFAPPPFPSLPLPPLFLLLVSFLPAFIPSPCFGTPCNISCLTIPPTTAPNTATTTTTTTTQTTTNHR